MTPRHLDGYRRLVVAAGAAGVAGLAASALLAPGHEADHAGMPVEARSAEMSSCPDVDPTSLPASFAVHDRQLRNLGANVHGRSITLASGSRVVVFHVGHDALDEYEDLDFHVVRSAELGGRSVRVLTAGAASAGAPVLAAVWDEPDIAAPCNAMTAITTSAGEAELIGFVAAVRLER